MEMCELRRACEGGEADEVCELLLRKPEFERKALEDGAGGGRVRTKEGPGDSAEDEVA